MMKKPFRCAVLSLGLIGWCAYRNSKYPMASGYGALNKFVIPSEIFTLGTARLANTFLTLTSAFLRVPKGVRRTVRAVTMRDGAVLPLSIYRPENLGGDAPCLVFFHGGGFLLRESNYLHRHMCEYAKKAGCVAVFVHYRTADRVAFPVPFDDCCDAVEDVWQHAEELGIDRKRLAIGGDSAGGALAAACAQWCQTKNISLCYQLLIYPVCDRRMQTRSSKQFTDAPLWNSALSKRMWRYYLRDGVGTEAAYASPAEAEDLRGLPPAYVEVCQWDSLRDEGLAYARRLRAAVVPVTVSYMNGACHGFDVPHFTALTKSALAKRCQALKDAFTTMPTTYDHV